MSDLEGPERPGVISLEELNENISLLIEADRDGAQGILELGSSMIDRALSQRAGCFISETQAGLIRNRLVASTTKGNICGYGL